jgi:hypothetical protein
MKMANYGYADIGKLADFANNSRVGLSANDIMRFPRADVQPVKKCKMIPQKTDCRGYTDVFLCTNCQLHIHLGFISKNYGGNFCLECGAEVEDGEQK